MVPWKYEREFLKKERREKEWIPMPMLSLGLYIADRVREKRGKSIRETRFEDLLLRRREQIRYGEAVTFAEMILILLLGITITVLLFQTRGSDAVRELTRPAFGSESNVSLKVRFGDTEENMVVSVSGRDPAGEELTEVLDEAFESLKTECLGENTSLSEVSRSLVFPDEDDRGVEFRYESLEPELLSDYGIILAEEFPEGGIPVAVKVTASYNETEKEYLLEMVLCAPVEKLTPREEVEKAVREADESSRGESTLVLPEEAGELELSFRQEKTSPWIGVGVAGALAVLMYFLPKEQEKEKEKAREKELRLSYPKLLSKLSTLIHAGMSIRSAWTRIVSEYREGRKSGGRKMEYAYEEMSLALLRIEQGENERDAYEEFGRRCTLRTYRKLGNLLGQNLRQGISGLEGALQEEMEKALEERKNEALRAGEEAGTKLLFPMILMLGIVVVSLVVPAFLSF